MSFLSCISCQVARSLLSKRKGQVFHIGKFSSNNSRPFSVTASTPKYFKLPANCRRLPEAVSSIKKEKFFCTKASKPETNLDGFEGEHGGSEDDGLIKRRMNARNFEELERSLTDEERQVLKELEEEERRFREQLQTGSEQEDYFVWDGTFEKDGSGGSKLTGSVSESHVTFENRQRVIQDVIEEMWDPLPLLEEEEQEPVYYPRGRTGVFDLGELVELLREEHADEVVAIALPKELDYADYMLIVTVSNNKHLVALAQFVRKRFKMKEKKPTDKIPGLDKSVQHHGWIALDLGNIILHIFIQKTRDYYDLETLWTVGPIYDDLTNALDPEIVRLLNSIK